MGICQNFPWILSPTLDKSIPHTTLPPSLPQAIPGARTEDPALNSSNGVGGWMRGWVFVVPVAVCLLLGRGTIVSGAVCSETLSPPPSLCRERIWPVWHFLTALTGLKETINASQLPPPGKVLEEEEREGREVCKFAKSFKATVESREQIKWQSHWTNSSWNPLKGQSADSWGKFMEPPQSKADGLLNCWSFRKEESGGGASAPGLDPEMLDFEPCLPHEQGWGLSKVAGTQLPGPERGDQPLGKWFLIKRQADRQTDRWMGLLPSQTPPHLPGQTDGLSSGFYRLMHPSYQLWRQESVIFSPCLYCSGLICL